MLHKLRVRARAATLRPVTLVNSVTLVTPVQAVTVAKALTVVKATQVKEAILVGAATAKALTIKAHMKGGDLAGEL
jgi:hypothetical protein